jgi:hypothetical protein
MQEIKFRISPADLARLDRDAAASGISRSQLIRSRALASPMAPLSTADYHALVADALAATRGNLPRLHVECLVAFVVQKLYEANHSRSVD